jgi:hypothetical protein
MTRGRRRKRRMPREKCEESSNSELGIIICDTVEFEIRFLINKIFNSSFIIHNSSILFTLIILSDYLFASPGHSQYPFLGGRASLMGGAYTSLSSDSAGAYYNPAGLVEIPSSTFSASVSALYINRETVSDSIGSATVSGDVKFLELASIPSIFGFFHKLKPKSSESGNEKSIVIGLSILVPSQQKFTSQGTASSGESRGYSAINYTQEFYEQAYFFGPSIAIPISSRLYAGATFYYHFQLERNFFNIMSSDSVGTYFYSEEMSASGGNFIEILGFKFIITESLSLGLTVRPPSLRLHGNARYNEVDGGYGQFSSYMEPSRYDNLDYTYKIPVKIAMGASYGSEEKYIISLDSSISFPVGKFARIKDPAYFSEKLSDDKKMITERKLVFNVNFGISKKFSEKITGFGGFFTDFSPVTDNDRSPSKKTDRYGVSLGFSMKGERNVADIGLVFMYESGREKKRLIEFNEAKIESKQIEGGNITGWTAGLITSYSYLF